VVVVAARHPGAPAEEVEQSVIVPLEKGLANLPGLKGVASRSYRGAAYLDLTLAPAVDFAAAHRAVTERLKAVTLPVAVALQVQPGRGYPRVALPYTLHNPRDKAGRPFYTPGDLRTVQDQVLRPAFEHLPGVYGVAGSGGAVRRYEVQPDPERLQRYGITIPQLQAALARFAATDQAPGGWQQALTLKRPQEAIACLRAAEARRLAALRRVVVATVKKAPVRVDDVVDGGPLPPAGGKPTGPAPASATPRGVRVGYRPLIAQLNGEFLEGFLKVPVLVRPRAPTVGASRLRRNAGKPERDRGGDRDWDVEDDVVCGVVLADGDRAAAAVLARIKELNEIPGRLPPGVWVEPFPAALRQGPPNGSSFVLTVRLPDVEPLALRVEAAAAIRKLLRSRPEVEAELTRIGITEDGVALGIPHETEILVALKPRGDWPVPAGKAAPPTQAELKADIVRFLQDRFLRGYIRLAPLESGGPGKPFAPGEGEGVIKVLGPDPRQVAELASRVWGEVGDVRGVGFAGIVEDDRKGSCLALLVDREKCATLGANPSDALDTLALAGAGRMVGRVVEGGQALDITLCWPERLVVSERHEAIPRWGDQDDGDMRAIRSLPLLASGKKDRTRTPAALPPTEPPLLAPEFAPRTWLGDVLRMEDSGTASCSLYRERGLPLMGVWLKARGRPLADVLKEARAATEALFRAPYQAEWLGTRPSSGQLGHQRTDAD
jgi:Cu/Ag efflux pump CusA